MAAEKPILLHSCCAPCTVYPFERLADQGYSATCLFYNPNIHPYTEFVRRLDAMKVFGFETGAEVLLDDRYGLDEFLAAVFGREPRCPICYEMRLRETARVCGERKLERFTTTLLYSKYQRHDDIVKLGGRLADEYGVEFVYFDFRVGWKEGILESKRMGLYRQQYCGCIFSEQERYLQKKKRDEV
ncbi:MAG TPA: epoxyqueuosine reductase QueH [bacterium]|nr:epoxyqueuosine reductase QueH [bacterium]